MTKEKVFEELLTKRSAASQTSSSANDGSLDWQKTGGLDEDQLKIGKELNMYGIEFLKSGQPKIFVVVVSHLINMI